MPNFGSVIARHNAKILRKSAPDKIENPPNCNCKKSFKKDCPMPDQCNQDGAIYQATVTSSDGKKDSYVGLAKNFKRRYGKHKKCLADEFAEGGGTLQKYFWKQKNNGKNPTVTWKYLEKNVPTYNPVTRKCRLCLREKYNIVLKTELATINSRQEMFGHCRHMQAELIGGPPG